MSSVKKIADLKDREEVTVEVVVTKINDVRQFTKRDGSQGRVRNIRVKDETGECRVALWDDDIGMVEQLDIVEGSNLRCENCYVKHTDYGTDLTKGRKGSIIKL